MTVTSRGSPSYCTRCSSRFLGRFTWRKVPREKWLPGIARSSSNNHIRALTHLVDGPPPRGTPKGSHERSASMDVGMTRRDRTEAVAALPFPCSRNKPAADYATRSYRLSAIPRTIGTRDLTHTIAQRARIGTSLAELARARDERDLPARGERGFAFPGAVWSPSSSSSSSWLVDFSSWRLPLGRTAGTRLRHGFSVVPRSVVVPCCSPGRSLFLNLFKDRGVAS